MQRGDHKSENKKVAVFFLALVAALGGVAAWLSFAEPTMPVQKVTKDIGYDAKR